MKDLLQHLDEKEDFHWQTLIRPAYFVPETKKINDLLEEFQTKKVHLAIVVDEYGGTTGIVTMEDIIEEIVGDINDEYDEQEIVYTRDKKMCIRDRYNHSSTCQAREDQTKHAVPSHDSLHNRDR